MSFCQTVKGELCRKTLKKECCQQAFLYAVLRLSRSFLWDGTIVTTENRGAAQKIARDLAGVCGAFVSISADYRYVKDHPLVYTVFIEDTEEKEELARRFSLQNEGIASSFLEKECCVQAFLKGAFLAFGQVTDPEKEYHLEMGAPGDVCAGEMCRLLEKAGFFFKISNRKRFPILYLKDSEQIADFLTYLGAAKAAMQIMDIKVLKTVRNQLNRQVNCETANLKKTTFAAADQMRCIRYLEAHGGLSALGKELETLARLRLENEDASLRELAAMLDPPVSYSAVNRRLKKIIEMAVQKGAKLR